MGLKPGSVYHNAFDLPPQPTRQADKASVVSHALEAAEIGPWTGT
ncbi:MAG: hypothetical protein ACJ8AW_53495 [Rhodopila sp.]